MKTALGLFGLAVLALALWTTVRTFQGGLEKAPDVAFKDITGARISLPDLRGKPVLVTFWATTCSICIREIPDLIALHREFASEGFRLLAIAMYYDPPNQVVETARHWQFPYSVALDLKAELADAFGAVRQVPANFLIAPDGSIALHQLGKIDPEQMRALIRQMLPGSSG